MAQLFTTQVQYDANGHVIRSLPPDFKVVVGRRAAHLIVDVQTAFMTAHEHRGRKYQPGGLPVVGAHEVIDPIVEATTHFADDMLIATLDQHLAESVGDIQAYDGVNAFTDLTVDYVADMTPDQVVSKYFDLDYLRQYVPRTPRKSQTVWTTHAGAGTLEAQLHPGIAHLHFRRVSIKGMDPLCDSNSPILDNMLRPTLLGDVMVSYGIEDVFVSGNCYDVCAGLGALHSRQILVNGRPAFRNVFILKDTCRSTGIPGLEKLMDDDLLNAGVHIIMRDQLARAE